MQSPKLGALASFKTVSIIIVAYCAIHYILRLTGSPLFTVDEAEQVLMSQHLDWGYRFRHPPLITWIYALADATGINARPVFFAIKYIIMALGYLAFYRGCYILFESVSASEMATQPRIIAALSTLAWGLIYFPAWGHHEDLMHTVLLFTLLCASFDAFILIIVRGTWPAWLYFGATIALGFLSKYVHTMFPVCALLAVIWMHRRGNWPFTPVDLKKLAGALGLSLLMLAPYFVWMASAETSLVDLAGSVTSADTPYSDQSEDTPFLLGKLIAIGSLMSALIEFTIPFGLFFPLIYVLGTRSLRTPSDHTDPPTKADRLAAWQRLTWLPILFGCVLFAAVLLAGAASFKARWMHQVLITLPVACFLLTCSWPRRGIRDQVFLGLVAIITLTIMIVRPAVWHNDIQRCNIAKCRMYLPAEQWARSLSALDLAPGTLVGAEHQLTGNLVYRMDGFRGIDAAFEIGAYGPPQGNGSCLAVWRGSEAMPDRLAAYLRRALSVEVTQTKPEGAFTAPLIKSQTKADTLYYRQLPNSELCR